LLIAWAREHKPSMTGALTGAVAGLACVTPAAGYVQPWAAAIIGILAGSLCYGAVIMRARMGWDDALDVWGCHGVGGVLGLILTGVFAAKGVNGTSGLIEGNVSQFAWQCAAAAISAGYSFVVTFVALKVINLFTPVRVPEAVEEQGLDEAIHGEKAYDLGA
jgi:ammonium transporter, Amt family